MSYNLLKGKRGIIFGALNDQSIAWKVAERAVEEGATITLSNTPMAIRMGEVNALAEKLNCQVVPADATSVEDLTNVFKTSMDILGGQIDFVLHSIGMSPNVRKKRTYDDLGTAAVLESHNVRPQFLDTPYDFVHYAGSRASGNQNPGPGWLAFIFAFVQVL